MTITITFSTVALPSAKLETSKPDGADDYEATFSCHTKDYADITALQALTPSKLTAQRLRNGKTRITVKGGTKATLTINGTAHTNCYIAEISGIKEAPNALPFDAYVFSIRFVQETYSAT